MRVACLLIHSLLECEQDRQSKLFHSSQDLDTEQANTLVHVNMHVTHQSN